MAQRSITSFFAPKVKKAEPEEKNAPRTPEKKETTNGNLSDEPDGDSPVKQIRKRRPVIESDSEDDVASSPAQNGDSPVPTRTSPRKQARSESASPAAKSASPASKSASPAASSAGKTPLRITARKAVGGGGSTAAKQKELLQKMKTSPTSANGSASSPERSSEENGKESDVKEEPAEKDASEDGESPKEEKSNSDAEANESGKEESSPDKEVGKKKSNGEAKSSTGSRAKVEGKGVKRKSDGTAGGKAKKGRKSDTVKQEPMHEENVEMKEEKKKELKEEKKDEGEPDGECDAKKSPKEEAPEPAKKPRPMTGIFGLQRTASSSGADQSKTDGNKYDPSKKKYHPVNDATWKDGQKVPYLALARTFELVEATSARLKMVDILCNFFRSVIALSPADILPSIYLCLNRLAPAYHGIELGIGEGAITKAVAQATGRTVDKVRAEAAEKGDLGLVAESSKSRQRMMFRPAPLTVAGVFKTLKDIAMMSGQASMTKKVEKMQGLMVACRHAETRFIVRSLGGKLRIGLAEQSALQALAQACVMTPPNQERPAQILDATREMSAEKTKAAVDEAALVLKTVYCECPTYDEIVPVLLEHGLDKLPDHCKIRAGVPLKPMLAHPTKGVSEVLSRFEGAQFTCEYKYDGERAQIHLREDGSIHVYSRNQEDNTTKYPDIIARFRACLRDGVSSCILDSEAVAWDTEKKQILPFQVLSTRKRKDAGASEIKVQVCVFGFDLLFLNGESLVTQTFEKRREKLRASFKEVEGEFSFAKSMDSTNVEDIQEFLDESVKGNCEGLMVKTLDRDATYEIAKRSRNWLKLKKDYLDGVGDTIDVVVLGGFLGKGKRTGVYGGFLLGCYDPENEEFQSICKIGTGFSEEDLQKHSAFFKEHIIDAPKSYYRHSIEPDHWFDAVQVWEIKCADLSISPVHKAAVGIVDPEKGISLRFPRFLRVREDKTAEQATSAQQIADMYNSQDQVKNQASNKGGEDEEFY
ncbi:DNA ligase 1-like isoform X2 [Amphibalanus amphitrite]|uniref:DNA ligase 1-like isoform X2 n=1 Tax=Amphibalanus amphitrite TaxID=1232801 RepID=UPI001C91EC06|nr:DNA ligase 1-like isoform X2 [Amphibalanus amphitrite]XP_043196471.1 DNA ligase 1-like isoform X2 [Amphibalanus amphitrite]XP_043196472.1 DNA ligase 1-like isoform X2 [Amphibalanus amphitrite]XP_043196473.1 DNA ligase 1-like isoform X2 [Amphibalanus amphitrite]